MSLSEHPLAEPNVFASARKHWQLVAASVAAFAFLGALVAMTKNSLHAAEAGIIVSDPRPGATSTAGSARDQARYVADQVAILESLPVAESAIDIARAAGNELKVSSRELDRRTSISSSPDSNYITVRVSGTSPAEAQVAANSIVAAYRKAVTSGIDATIAAELRRLNAAIGALRDGPADEKLRRELVERRSQLQVDARSTSDGVTLFSRAELGTKQGVPFKSAVVLALVLGGLVGIGLAYAVDARAQGVSSRLDPQRLLNARALAEIPSFQKEGAESPLPVLDAPESGPAEAFRFLAFTLEVSPSTARDQRVEHGGWWKRELPEIAEGPLEVLEIWAGGSSNAEIARRLGVGTGEVDGTIRYAIKTMGVKDRRELRARIQTAMASWKEANSGAAHSIAFVGASPGDGTTTLVANTALAVAQEGYRVLAVDADISKRGLTKLFESRATDGRMVTWVGLTDVLLAPHLSLEPAAQVLESEAGGSVSLMSPGPAPTDLSLFRSEQVQTALNKVGDEFDVVLIDVPAILRVAYAGAFLRSSSSSVVVVRHGTAASRVRDVRERLDLLGIEPFGFVYNVGPTRTSDRSTRLKAFLERHLGNWEPSRSTAPAPSKAGEEAEPAVPLVISARSTQDPG